MPPLDADLELRALDLYGRLSERPGDEPYRRRLLRRAGPALAARVADLERSAVSARIALPTELPAPRPPPGPPPEQVGPYRLAGLIGEGGMGQVYRAERCDGLFEQTVAIKLVHAHLAHLAAGRFAEERRILARLEHPNISRLIDGGMLEDGTPYLVMEFVPGRPIDQAAQGLSDRARVGLLLQAADAVQFAHAQLIVHADLKPSNILVDEAGRARLLDFGVARLLGEEPVGEVSHSQAHPMTPDFASPERVAGAPAVVADDVFALGLVLEGLVAGSRDPDLEAIASRARAPLARDRYGSVAALIADLGRWRDRLPVEARAADGMAYRARKFLERHKLGVILTAGAIAALSAATVFTTVSYLRAEQARAEARARFEQARAAAHYLLFDLGDRLERQPQSLALRAQVAQVSQSYLDQLGRAPGAPVGVKIESAQGLLKLAERQGMPGRPNLGQLAQARRNLATAYALALSIPGREGRRLRALTRLDQAHLAEMADNDFPTAERLLAEARTIVFDPRTPQRDLQRSWYAEMAGLRQWQARYPASLAAARAGLAAPAPADPLQAMISEAGLQDVLAETTYYAGRPADAVAPYRRRMALLEEARRRWPDDPKVARLLPQSRWSLGLTLVDVGRSAEAEPILARGVDEAHAAAAFEPSDRDAARTAGMLDNAHAQALAALGRPGEAIPILARAVEARRGLMQANPGVGMPVRDYAIALAALGDIEGQAGRRADACAHYDQAWAAWAALRARGRVAGMEADNSQTVLRQGQARYCR